MKWFDQMKCILCPTWGNCSDKCSDFQRILYRLLWRGLISFWQHSAVTAPHWPNYIISCYYLFSSLQIFLSRYIYMCVSEWGHSKEKEKKERGGRRKEKEIGVKSKNDGSGQKEKEGTIDATLRSKLAMTHAFVYSFTARSKLYLLHAQGPLDQFLYSVCILARIVTASE